MWSLRRASATLRKQGLGIENSYSRFATLPCVSNRFLEDCDKGVNFPAKVVYGGILSRKFHKRASSAHVEFWGTCRFSTQVDTSNTGEEDNELDDGFSDLEAPAIQNDLADNHEELVSEPDLAEDAIDVLEQEVEDSLDTVAPDKLSKKRFGSTLFKEILDNPTSDFGAIVTNWKKKGNELTRPVITEVMVGLRKRRLFGKALQLSEWMESSEEIDLTDRDYACRVDLIAKARSLQKAEAYLRKIPKQFCGELVYRTLLANSVYTLDVKKTEEIFNKMRELGLPLSSFAFNQMIALYKKTDKKKISDVLLLMDKEGVKPSRYTYLLLIDIKGQVKDIDAMEKIVETMKSDGFEPDVYIKGSIAKHYIAGGRNEKAEAVMKEMEEGDEKERRFVRTLLLPLYASLGKAEEVSRIWEACKSKPSAYECLAAIPAWGNLKKIEEAEEAFETLLKKHVKSKDLISKAYHVLLSVYAEHKMLEKGNELVKRMGQNHCQVGPFTWDALVKLYCNAGEVEKADSILKNAATKGQKKPLYRSYATIMEQYAAKGDIHNCEKMLYRMRQVGYTSRLKQFQTLLQAYINAKAPAYGMSERMKADNIFPNRTLAGLLAQVDGFRQAELSEILD
ncbi:unnamed protein product [Cuscuta epithymum]|uniref:Pentatricopeptide repeat-containing protein n=1 Tax=Cuscuta epithymum TaxID=186058 RepID=A0AAV0FHG1_9ASTE|nr:unnamed protein product [Cuscuta epithymum]